MTAITAWLRQRIAEAEEDTTSDERARRLESDAEAVQVLTIHRSKGLEFRWCTSRTCGSRGTCRSAAPPCTTTPATATSAPSTSPSATPPRVIPGTTTAAPISWSSGGRICAWPTSP